MRIKEMITQDEFNWYFKNFSSLLLKEMHSCSNKWELKKKKDIILGMKGLQPAGIYKPCRITICFNLKIIWLQNFLE